MAKVVPLDAPEPGDAQQRLGFLRGQFAIPDDFITMGEDEIIRMFNGDLPNDGWPEEAGPGPEGA